MFLLLFQIVRADINELYTMDLGGAPYAFTPFCESRKEMDGFRFWKQGYWRNHLQGRKYHISALYVVDLKRFRKVAAGDRLRGQYQVSFVKIWKYFFYLNTFFVIMVFNLLLRRL